MKKTRIALIVLLLLVVVGGGGALLYFSWGSLEDAKIDYEVAIDSSAIPHFTAVELDHEHQHDGEHAQPLVGSAVFELDGEPPEELFIGGGYGQDDVLYRYEGGAMVAIDGSGYDKGSEQATLGAISIDADRDGDDDLLVARADGIVLYENREGQLHRRELDAPMDESTSPISIAVADIDGDGDFDMFVAGYIHVAQMDGLTNFSNRYGGISRLMRNDGDDHFTDITEESGLLYQKNTFQGMFADVDTDGDLDLIVAHDTSNVRTWRNLGDGHFENVPNPSTGQRSYPMGIAMGDYDNDGELDFFFSNVGSTPPAQVASGSGSGSSSYHPQWWMFHGGEGFEFTDTAEQTRVAAYEFSWGAVFEDFNLDGRSDLVVSENYVDWGPHAYAWLRLPGRFFIQNDTGEFAAVGAEAGVENSRFGISPLTADFNGDGYPDLVHVNVSGRSQLFLSEGGDQGYVRVRLPNDVRSIGAVVHATLSDGRVVVEPYVSGEGLCSDSSHVITVGAGDATVASLEVRFLDGQVVTVRSPPNREVTRVEPPSAPTPNAPTPNAQEDTPPAEDTAP